MTNRRKVAVEAEAMLRARGLDYEALTREDTELAKQRWREVFARPLHRALGVWRYRGYDWHTFSYEHTYARSGADAAREYSACVVGKAPLLLLPNGSDRVGCRVRCTAPPDLHGAADVYVCAHDFAWTMVFTHEDGMLGPYFCRAQWIDHPPR